MAERLEDVLRPGEQIVWEGRSRRRLTFNAYDFPLMTAGVMGAVIGVGLVLQGQLLLGLPILVAGAYLGGGQLIVETWRRRHTWYVLTLDHAYLVHSWPRQRTTTVDLRRCGPSTITHHRDGTGTITFGPFPTWLRWFGPARWEHPAFRFIDAADQMLPVLRGDAPQLAAEGASPRSAEGPEPTSAPHGGPAAPP